ncbi:MAG: hypothetical protein REI94_05700 [Moraxellaceae bacterium]|nr:hypothetical protein [Moraxellaceae bacterium]
MSPFLLSEHLTDKGGIPLLDWEAANTWTLAIPDEATRAAAWTQLERAWLERLQQALGPAYSLRETDGVFLLSTLATKAATVTLDYMTRTLKRIVRLLDGIAQVPEWGKDILIVFEDAESYYRYVSLYYAEDGEFALSGGMFIHAGCGHFATVRADLSTIEPVIAHEMTHGCLSHLPIPAWLNEGLAVNTEQKLSPSGAPLYTPQQMHARHLAFWGNDEIQEFWSGKSFLRADDGNMLSYDLARILVSQFSQDWDSFRAFVIEAHADDGGHTAAATHLGLDLGIALGSILERDSADGCAPDPASWCDTPERGAF